MNDKKAPSSNGKKGYLFNVEILVEGYNNGIALESLLGILNTEKIKDYKIKSGIELGKIIDAVSSQANNKTQTEPAANSPTEERKSKTPSAEAEEVRNDDKDIIKLLSYFKENNTLIRLSILKGKGVKMSIPCRVLNLDESNYNLTVYHVDEKKVYQFNLSEIDDYKVN